MTWFDGLREGIRRAMDTARYCRRLAKEQPENAAYWLSETRRHHDRVRKYIHDIMTMEP